MNTCWSASGRRSKKSTSLLDFDFLHAEILKPTLQLAVERGCINRDEEKVLRIGINKQQFKSGDLEAALEEFRSLSDELGAPMGQPSV